MKNSIKVIIAVVAVALIGGGVYYSNTGLQQGSLGNLRGSLNSQSGSLVVSRDSLTNVKSSQIVAGTTNVTFAAFKLTAGNTDLRIKQITIRNMGSNTDGIVNIGLYDGSRLLDATKANRGTIKTALGADGDPKAVTFIYESGSPVVIPKNSSKVITVKANTVYAATAGQTVQFKIEGIQFYNTPGATIRTIVSYASDTDALKVLYPTKLNFAWAPVGHPALGPNDSHIQVEVARFTMGADTANANNPGAGVSVSSLGFEKLITVDALSNFSLLDVTNNVMVASNATYSYFHGETIGGTFSAQTFLQGETRTYSILADIPTNAGRQAAQFRFNANGAIWSVTNNNTTITATADGDPSSAMPWTVLTDDARYTTSPLFQTTL